MDRRVPTTTEGPTMLDVLALIRDPIARDLIATACAVLVDPNSSPAERSLAARWSDVYSDDLTVGDLQARVSFVLPWPPFWPPELRVVRTVQDYCREIQSRPGLPGSPYDGQATA